MLVTGNHDRHWEGFYNLEINCSAHTGSPIGPAGLILRSQTFSPSVGAAACFVPLLICAGMGLSCRKYDCPSSDAERRADVCLLQMLALSAWERAFTRDLE